MARGHLGHLERVGEAGALVVVREHEHLGLAGQAAERRARAGSGPGHARSRCAPGPGASCRARSPAPEARVAPAASVACSSSSRAGRSSGRAGPTSAGAPSWARRTGRSGASTRWPAMVPAQATARSPGGGVTLRSTPRAYGPAPTLPAEPVRTGGTGSRLTPGRPVAVVGCRTSWTSVPSTSRAVTAVPAASRSAVRPTRPWAVRTAATAARAATSGWWRTATSPRCWRSGTTRTARPPAGPTVRDASARVPGRRHGRAGPRRHRDQGP